MLSMTYSDNTWFDPKLNNKTKEKNILHIKDWLQEFVKSIINYTCNSKLYSERTQRRLCVLRIHMQVVQEGMVIIDTNSTVNTTASNNV